MPRILSINFDLINDDDLSKLNATKESILDGILLLAKILVAKSTFEKVVSRSDLIELYKLLNEKSVNMQLIISSTFLSAKLNP